MSTISTKIYNPVVIGSANYPSPLTITKPGAVEPGYPTHTSDYGATAVSSSTAGVTLNNNGIIVGALSAPGGVGGIGVDLTASATVNNYNPAGNPTVYGAIDGGRGNFLGGSGGEGLYLAAGTLTNYGEINGGSGFRNHSGGVGVNAPGGTVINNGIIVGGSGYGLGNGAVGIQMGANTQLTNSDEINGGVGGEAAGTSGAAGVLLAAGATLTNTGFATIMGGNGGGGYGANSAGAGVDLAGSGATVSNAGSIEGGGFYGSSIVSPGAGVYLTAGTALTNTGFIVGGTGGAGGVGVLLDGGTVTSSGHILGGDPASGMGHGDAVQFGPTASAMIVQYGAFFAGNIGGFATGGDRIDITNLTPTQVASDFGATPTSLGSGVYAFNGNAGGDTLTTGATGDGTLNFAGNYGSDEFVLTPDGTGGTNITLEPVCYLRGTRILTPTGEALIEALKRGDSVVTRFGGLQRIKWIGRQSYRAAAVRENREHIPVHLRASALGEGLPARDLYVSPGHSMLIEDTLVLAKSLVNGITITQSECPERIDYFQIELEGHDCVIAEGTWSETYADWEDGRRLFHNAAEFHALFPEYRAPDAPMLCAPRPERGSALDAVLRPIVVRAGGDLAPGALRGYIDVVRGDWKLDGWAHDEAHPELPVLLEILLEGKVIGTVLACDYREDLLKAGFGRGRCSFTFISPVKLRPALLSTLQVRRAVDGGPVAVSPSILDAALEPAVVKPRLAIVA